MGPACCECVQGFYSQNPNTHSIIGLTTITLDQILKVVASLKFNIFNINKSLNVTIMTQHNTILTNEEFYSL